MWKRLRPSEARLHPSHLRFPMRLMQRIMWWRWWWDTLSGFYNESFKGVSADSKTQYFLCNTERVSITTDAEKGINERYLPFSHGICFRLYSTYVHHFLLTTDTFWLRLLQHSVWTIHHDSIFPYSTIPLRPNSNIYIYILHILQWELESREYLKPSCWSYWNCLNSWSCRVWSFSSLIQIRTISRILLRFNFGSMTRNSSSNVKRYGLTARPSTIRLRAWRSTDWASPAVSTRKKQCCTYYNAT